MLYAVLAVSAIVPSLLLVWYFHARDAFPEPPRVLWTTFGLGIFIIFPVLVVVGPIDALIEQMGNPLVYGFTTAFLGAAIPEELMKLLVLWLYASRHVEFDEPMDGIVYGATASLGFATLENILYVADGGFGVAVMRAVLSVPGHAFTGAIMGYFVGQAKFASGGRGGLIAKAVTIPILLHGFYDFPLLAASRIGDVDTPVGCVTALLLPLAPAIVIFEWVWTVRLVRRLRRDQLSDAGPPLAEPLADLPPPAPPVVPVKAPEAVAAVAEKAPGKVLGWFLTIGGGLLATGGGLMTLGLVLAVAMGVEEGTDVVELVVGALILGVLPLLGGAALFVWGVVRLNRTYRR